MTWLELIMSVCDNPETVLFWIGEFQRSGDRSYQPYRGWQS